MSSDRCQKLSHRHLKWQEWPKYKIRNIKCQMLKMSDFKLKSESDVKTDRCQKWEISKVTEKLSDWSNC